MCQALTKALRRHPCTKRSCTRGAHAGGGVTANRDGLSEGKRSFWVVREGSGGLAGWSA